MTESRADASRVVVASCRRVGAVAHGVGKSERKRASAPGMMVSPLMEWLGPKVTAAKLVLNVAPTIRMRPMRDDVLRISLTAQDGDQFQAAWHMIRDHFDGVVAWAQTRQTNGFLEAINGLFQAAKRKARGYGNFITMRIVVYLVAGDLDFTAINPHVKA